MKFEEVLPALRNGERLTNASLSKFGGYIVRQIPQSVAADVIPKMTSLPDSAKDAIMRGGGDLRFFDQVLVVYRDYMAEGYKATSWAPSCFDLFREDWTIA